MFKLVKLVNDRGLNLFWKTLEVDFHKLFYLKKKVITDVDIRFMNLNCRCQHPIHAF